MPSYAASIMIFSGMCSFTAHDTKARSRRTFTEGTFCMPGLVRAATRGSSMRNPSEGNSHMSSEESQLGQMIFRRCAPIELRVRPLGCPWTSEPGWPAIRCRFLASDATQSASQLW